MENQINYGFTIEEEQAFQELKTIFSDVIETNAENDFRLYRFLKARKYDVKKAEVMFSKHLRFRRKWKLDTILEEHKTLEPIKSYTCENILGEDKDGALVVFADAGRFDAIGMMKSLKREYAIEHMLFLLEYGQRRIFKLSQKAGKPLGCTAVIDGQGFIFSTATNKAVVELAIDMAFIFEANYPELQTVTFGINVPIYFNYFYNIAKKLLPSALFQKARIYRKDGWLEEILKLVDPDLFPAYLGGNLTDPDGNPECFATINRGKPIPKHYYLDNSEQKDKLKYQPDVQMYDIKSGSRIEISHIVDTPNSFLEWQIESEARDIGFGLLYQSRFEEEMEELISIQRVSAHLQCEVGTLVCEKQGIYVIVLDNSFSWIRGKQIYMKSIIRKPKLARKEENS